MAKPYWMELLVEFVRPGHSELSATNIPPLDGVLRPNNGLHDRFEPLLVVPQPWDVLVADRHAGPAARGDAGDGGGPDVGEAPGAAENGPVFVASGRQVLTAERPGGAPQVVAGFEGWVSCLDAAPDGRLLVGVGGRGVVALDADGSVEDLVTAAQGTPVTCPTAVAVGPDGRVYVADGSRHHPPEDWAWDLMGRHASGRIVRHDPATGATDVLCDRLAYPAGVTVAPDGTELLFTTAWDHSLHRLNLADRRMTTVLRGMSGYPGKLSRAGESGYWLAMFAMRTHLVEFVLTEHKYRAEMMRTIHPDYWIRPALKDLNTGLEPLQGGGIKKLGIKKPWAPPRSYGMAIRLDERGEPIASFQSTADRDRHGVLSVRQYGDEVLIACYGADAVLVGKADDACHPAGVSDAVTAGEEVGR